MTLLVHGHRARGANDRAERHADYLGVGDADELLAVEWDRELGRLIGSRSGRAHRIAGHGLTGLGFRFARVVVAFLHHRNKVHRADRALVVRFVRLHRRVHGTRIVIHVVVRVGHFLGFAACRKREDAHDRQYRGKKCKKWLGVHLDSGAGMTIG